MDIGGNFVVYWNRGGAAPGPAMNEVMGHAPVWMATMARAHGKFPEAALARLPFTEAELKTTGTRIDWSAFVDFMEPFEVACGGPAALTEGAEKQYAGHALDHFPVLGLVVAPRDLCRFIHRAVFPRAYGGAVRATDENDRDGRLRIRMEIVEPHPPSLPFFHACEGSIRGIPHLFGQPSAEVVAEIEPRRATFLVRFPPARTITSRLRRVLLRQRLDAVLDDTESNWTELGRLRSELEQSKRPAPGAAFDACYSRVVTAWGLTPRQLEVVAELVRGASNKEIAERLGLALHTVEVHVTEVLRRTGHSNRSALVAAFWER
jgi:DNA-binding CsgD family transcriptional regulator